MPADAHCDLVEIDAEIEVERLVTGEKMDLFGNLEGTADAESVTVHIEAPDVDVCVLVSALDKVPARSFGMHRHRQQQGNKD